MVAWVELREAPMMIGVSEGQGWRYEVDEAADGYLVRMRDLATGAVEIGEARLFRTAAVAFAYAELSAAFDRYAAARIDGSGGAAALLADLTACQALFDELSRRLGDEGLAAQVLAAWEAHDAAQERRRLH
jgi:hypothetical protein